VACVAFAALLTWPLRLVTVEGSRFLFVYILPIGAAGYLGGRFAGFLAAVIAGTIMWFPVLPPVFAFTLQPATVPTAVTFFLTGIAAAFAASHVGDLERSREAGAAAEREDKERLALALEAGRLGSWEWDVASGRVTWSPILEQIHGLRPGSFEGTFEAYQKDIHPDDRDRVLAAISTALAGSRDYEIEYRIVLPDGQVRWLNARGKVDRDRRGSPLRMGGVCSDITETKMLEEFRTESLIREKAARRESETARERLGLLLEAGTLMASSLDYATTLRNVARAAVPNFADWCVFDLIQPDGSIERAAILHRDPAKLEIANDIARLYPPDPEVLTALQTGSPRLFPELTEDLIKQSATNEEHLRLLRALELKSAMLIPLKARGRTLGLLYLATSESERRYDEEDLALAEALGRRAALHVENARLYAREHLIAQTLQHAFLPKDLPRLPGILVDAAYVPAAVESELGGDWYDAFQLNDGRIVLSIGDVTGHGLQAAVSMGQVRQAIRAAAYEGDPPAAILARANRLLTRSTADTMATALVGILDPATMMFSHATAGHPTPLLTIADGTVKALPSGGLPLGMRAIATVPAVAGISLPLGALLVLYTDGLIEHDRDPVQGEAELIQAIRAEVGAPSLNPARTILDRVLGGKDPHDDVAILLVAVDPVPLKTLDLTLPAIPSTLPLVRQSLQQLAGGVGLDQGRLAALQIAVGEAMNNVIEHAYGVTPGTVHVRAAETDGRLVVEVMDAGEWRRERRDGGGRGLRIMRALVDDVTVERTEAGTSVRLSITRAAPAVDQAR
jgi:PAS domain S-box-containing protein